MLEIITGEALNGFKNKNQRQNDKIYKYTQMKRFHYDWQVQVYMYAFMYFNPEKIAEGGYFIDTINICCKL